MRNTFLGFSLLLYGVTLLHADGFICAGLGEDTGPIPSPAAAKPVQHLHQGMRHALLLFAQFRGEEPGWGQIPAWSQDIFAPEKPGSFSHFYDTMSFGRLQIVGEVAPQWYAAAETKEAYIAGDPVELGGYGRFSLEVLRGADREIDFSRFDNDGPDGIPNSGDDDGRVDALFLVLASTPAHFIIGQATGIAHLGFDRELITGDLGANGEPIRIDPRLGTLQQGRTFAETVGSLAHEYGHLLGLPDLYNVKFLQQEEAGPEDDSAGIGRWGLMGWGALGWNGNDGPTSFCAWSRMRLGWGEVREMGLEREEMRLEDVGRGGDMFKIPLGPGEYFLLEHRRRSSYYDRHIPGEGLLIWNIKEHASSRFAHQAQVPEIEGNASIQASVDLECADGRWLDAGFPLGQQADHRKGGDNLDFWAHDIDYAQRHEGNMGDATDPFDGVRYRAFTPETNPGSFALEERPNVRVEGIRLEENLAIAQVQTTPLQIVIHQLDVLDSSGDKIFTAGEEGTLRLRLHNQGGLAARDLHIALSSEDSLVEIIGAEADLGDLEVGYFSGVALNGERFPKIRISSDLDGKRKILLRLDIFAGEERIGGREFSLEAVSTFRLSGRVLDEDGEGIGGLAFSMVRFQSGILPRFRVKTGEGGRYEVDLPPGDYQMNLVADREGVMSSRYVSVEVARDKEFDVEMLRPFVVSGVVRDPEGQPISNVFISARDSYNGYYDRATTRQDGGYSMKLAPSTYSFDFYSESRLPSQSVRDIQVDGERTLDFDLQAGVEVTLQVVNEDGEGVSAGSVFFSGLDHSTSASSLKGITITKLLPDEYRIDFFQLSRPYIAPSLPSFSVLSDTTLQVVVRRGVAVTGRVRDELVEPFFDAYLRFCPLDDTGDFPNSIANDGTFSALLPRGRFLPVFRASESGRGLARVLERMDVWEEEEFDFTVERGMQVKGRVLDGAGESVADAEVRALSLETAVLAWGRTGEDGFFELPLKPGSYEFVVAYGSQYANLGMVEIPALDIVELRLSDRESLQGRVQDVAGNPLENVLVVLDHSLPAVMSLGETGFGVEGATHTDQNGDFHFEVPHGTYTVGVLPVGQLGIGRVVEDLVVDGAGRVDLVLPEERDLHRLQGQITDEPDLPRGRLVLQFFEEELGIMAQAVSGHDRGYHVELPGGLYRVRIGLEGPVGGILKKYDVGQVHIERDLWWNIDLSGTTTRVAETEAVRPEELSLTQNYPNPFNANTVIPYRLPEDAEVRLVIYDILGRRVKMLVDEKQRAGPHQVVWRGKDEGGRTVGSGVFFYRLFAGDHMQTRRMLLLK
jgi:M6 family metalloprotease-like protein